MPYKPAIEGLDFFKNFSLATGDARWLRLHGENSSQDADVNLFNAGARLGQSEAGKDLAIWRHATWDGATPSDQYIKIGFDGGGSPFPHIKTDGLYRGIYVEGLHVYSESGQFNNMWIVSNGYLSLMGGVNEGVNINFGSYQSVNSKYLTFGLSGSHIAMGTPNCDYLDISTRNLSFTASQGSVNLGTVDQYYPPSLNHYVRDWAGDGATWYVNYAYDGYTAHTYQMTRSNTGILAFDIQFPLKTTELIIDTTGTIHSTYAAGSYYYNLIQLADSSLNMYLRAGLYKFSLNNGSFGADSYMLTMNETNFNFAGTNGAERGIRFASTSNIIFQPAGGGGVGPTVAPENDASFDLGYYRDDTHAVRWRKLYLTDRITDGVNSILMGNPFDFGSAGITTLGTFHAHGYSFNTNVQTGSTYTVVAGDDVVIANKSTAVTVTLPLATGSGKVYFIKNINTGAVTVTADTTGTADKIDGAATYSLSTQYQSVRIVDGASDNWYVI